MTDDLTAAGVAPQEPSAVTDINGHSCMAWEESGKNGTYCRSCGGWAGKVGNRQCSPAPVLPSSGIDEDALAEVKAQAFEEAAKGVALMGTGKAVAWLRERAAEIREWESE